MISLNFIAKSKRQSNDLRDVFVSTEALDVAAQMARAIEQHGHENPGPAIHIFKLATFQKLNEIRDTRSESDDIRELHFSYVQSQLIPAILAIFENSEFSYHLATMCEAELEKTLSTLDYDTSTGVFYAKVQKK